MLGFKIVTINAKYIDAGMYLRPIGSQEVWRIAEYVEHRLAQRTEIQWFDDKHRTYAYFDEEQFEMLIHTRQLH